MYPGCFSIHDSKFRFNGASSPDSLEPSSRLITGTRESGNGISIHAKGIAINTRAYHSSAKSPPKCVCLYDNICFRE
ncbi:hypothetical protein DPMN_047968 [Dreissena polymorpha]|uniref:Uncharacterized protein n=1 Tax=Dreissena polymorpha TaxID=45954 RepID=A0A9D4I2E2_DREPO|nr:hypothetical protein DPMN_047968 [Dreissena polymorpha]